MKVIEEVSFMKKPGLDPKEENKFLKRLYRQDYQKLFLIFTEGTRTEPAYFEGFKRAAETISPSKALIEIVGVGQAAVKLLDYAKDFIEKYEVRDAEVWLVTDKDDFPDDQFNELVRQCARRDKQKYLNNYWHCAWSNECFELWFILHFSFYQAAATRTEYFRMLKEKYRQLGLETYAKNDRNSFEIMTKYGNPKNAVKWARKLYEEKAGLLPLRAIPCTTVYQLVLGLARYLPDELKQKYF